MGGMEPSADLLWPRRATRRIHVGSVAVGGGAPVSVQSMTTTKTADVEGTLAQVYELAAAGADIVRCTCNEERGGRGAGPDRAPLAGAHRGRHPLPPRDGFRRPRGRCPGAAPQPRQPAQGDRDQGDRRRGQGPRGAHPHRGERRVAPPRPLPPPWRGHPRGPGRVGPDGAGLLRGGRLLRREDLGQGLLGGPHGRRLPTGRRDLRPPAAPRGDRGRPAAGRPA